MAVEYSTFAGWKKNLKLANDSVELIVTLEVGPRIISYRSLQGGNVFKWMEEEARTSGEKEWKIRGGHRFWVGPEDFGKKESLTYAPDNTDVEHTIENDYEVTVSHVTESPKTLRREMVLSLDQTGPGVIVEHRLTNEGDCSLLVAPWALSVMAPGGCAIIPQPQPGKHPDDFVPNRTVILWPFTDFSDQRLLVGRHIIRLRQETGPPIKFGLRLTEGWAAYFQNGHLFVKSVPFLAEEIYPDLGSNFEAFTNAEFLELETLGPLKPLLAGEMVVHRESWVVFSEVTPPSLKDEEALRQWIEPYVQQLP